MDEDILTAAEPLTLVPVGQDRWQCVHNQDNRVGLLFGSQSLRQALAAA